MDYKNGQIYCIRSHQTDQIYIGSTCSPLAKRFYGHKNFNGCSSEYIMQYEDAYIELIENFPCNSKKELNKREGQHIRNTENCVNKHIPGRTRTERYDDKKNEINEKRKEYNEINKEKIAIRNKEYRETYKEHLAEKRKQRRLKTKFEATLIEPSSLVS